MNELQVLLAEELEVDSVLVPVTVDAIRRRGHGSCRCNCGDSQHD